MTHLTIQAHPEIKIMIGCDTKKAQKATDAGMRHMLLSMRPLMQLAGLSMKRLIVHRHVFAREIYLPMEGGCQDPVYNTWQILSMRKRFFRALNVSQPPPGGYVDHGDVMGPLTGAAGAAGATDVRGRGRRKRGKRGDVAAAAPQKKPVMLLMKRSTGAKHTRNAEDLVRQWNDDFTRRLVAGLTRTFPTYEVKLFSDQDEKLMGCHACQVRAPGRCGG